MESHTRREPSTAPTADMAKKNTKAVVSKSSLKRISSQVPEQQEVPHTRPKKTDRVVGGRWFVHSSDSDARRGYILPHWALATQHKSNDGHPRKASGGFYVRTPDGTLKPVLKCTKLGCGLCRKATMPGVVACRMGQVKEIGTVRVGADENEAVGDAPGSRRLLPLPDSSASASTGSQADPNPAREYVTGAGGFDIRQAELGQLLATAGRTTRARSKDPTRLDGTADQRAALTPEQLRVAIAKTSGWSKGLRNR